jgi:hypothetical protein
MSDTATTVRTRYYPDVKVTTEDDDLAPYASLFLRPLATNKSVFTRKELEAMCKDPLHSPRLIMYLIDMVKDL